MEPRPAEETSAGGGVGYEEESYQAAEELVMRVNDFEGGLRRLEAFAGLANARGDQDAAAAGLDRAGRFAALRATTGTATPNGATAAAASAASLMFWPGSAIGSDPLSSFLLTLVGPTAGSSKRIWRACS
jgi:hypothetical protein